MINASRVECVHVCVTLKRVMTGINQMTSLLGGLIPLEIDHVMIIDLPTLYTFMRFLLKAHYLQ